MGGSHTLDWKKERALTETRKRGLLTTAAQANSAADACR